MREIIVWAYVVILIFFERYRGKEVVENRRKNYTEWVFEWFFVAGLIYILLSSL